MGRFASFTSEQWGPHHELAPLTSPTCFGALSLSLSRL